MEYEVVIERLSPEGRGVAKIDGKTVFVDGALPGETVHIRRWRKHRRYDEAVTLSVLANPSPDRVDPKCAHFGVCGGCRLQHLAHPAQLAHKQQALLELLQQQADVVPARILSPLVAEPWQYRRKARLGVRYVHKKERLLVGFRERCKHYLADLQRCDVLVAAVGEHLLALAACLAELSCYRAVPQLEVAAADNAVALIVRHLEPLSAEDLAHLQAFSEKSGLWVYLQPKGPASVQRLAPQSEDRLYYELPAHRLRMYCEPTDFTQVNAEINQQMIDQAIDLLELNDQDEVLDVFCGLGNFSLPMARYAKRVTGVEGEAAMIERAQGNAAYNQLDNCQFYQANCFEPDPQMPWLRQSYDKILLDPPRSGAAELMPYLVKSGAERIVYVSCQPATLARDTATLVAGGYQLAAAGIMDMFAHTEHVEAMALFIK